MTAALTHLSASASPADEADPEILEAYCTDTRALLAARFPLAGGIFLGLMGLAYAIEGVYFPERWWPLSLSFLGFLVLVGIATLAMRRRSEDALPIALTASLVLTFAVTVYLAFVHPSAELVLLAMIGVLTGEVVQFPWGVRGQTVAAVGAFATFLWALAAGVTSPVPVAYELFALASHALMTVLGAGILDAYRFAAFRETALAERHAAASERANAAKSEFLATVSHELRTPLNIIVGYTDLILEDAFDGRDQERDALGRVRHQSRELLELIQSMLDLNRMEAGGISLEVEEIPVATVLAGLRGGLPASWQKPEVALHWEMDGSPAVVRSDRRKLETVLRNLVHNALKFTDRGEVTVTVRADPARRRVDFAVADTGPGIAEADLEAIFEMFGQGANGPPPRGGGVGLGLYIAKRLTEALGGEIAVTSRPGEGARFVVSLPLPEPGPGDGPASLEDA